MVNTNLIPASSQPLSLWYYPLPPALLPSPVCLHFSNGLMMSLPTNFSPLPGSLPHCLSQFSDSFLDFDEPCLWLKSP